MKRVSPESLAARLARGVAQMDVPVSAAQQARLIEYVELLAKWNRVYNLTAVRDPAGMVTRHVLDSLAVLPHVRGSRVLDVGTGGGLPGIPLAIALPEYHFVLLDSVAKKTRFVTQAAAGLALKNVTVETCRVERYRPLELFDTVVSRAFASLREFAIAAGPLCRPGGVLLAMKGRSPDAELHDLPPNFQIEGVVPLAVPGLEEERHVVIARGGF